MASTTNTTAGWRKLNSVETHELERRPGLEQLKHVIKDWFQMYAFHQMPTCAAAILRHGKSPVDRAELMERVGELLPSPDFKVDLAEQDHTIFIIVYHEVAGTTERPLTQSLTSHHHSECATLL